PALPEGRRDCAPVAHNVLYWRGVDVSHWTEHATYSMAGHVGPSLFDVLLDAGINVVRFNVFLDGARHPLNLTPALAVAREATRRGLAICVVLHLSDDWAYPSQQSKPLEWRSLDFTDLRRAVGQYTYSTISALCDEGLAPAIVQIGNEITNGFLWPE